jgi:hypothetical protein
MNKFLIALSLTAILLPSGAQATDTKLAEDTAACFDRIYDPRLYTSTDDGISPAKMLLACHALDAMAADLRNPGDDPRHPFRKAFMFAQLYLLGREQGYFKAPR